MGEICVKQFRENIPLAIIRPTMVTSSYREPFPGWIEGLSDGVIAAYGKGKVKCFLGSPMSILDLIPCDVVINVIMVAMAAHAKKSLLVEKVLRIQPNVKKLYLLIRASDGESASKRMHIEVLGKELFRVLRQKWETNFDQFISEKVAAIPGDVSCENLGVIDSQLREILWQEIDVVINSAATTSFDGRYDVALGTNTLGVLQVLSFAKKCVNLEMLVHVSTAYVCGEREGTIPEDTIFYMGKTIKSEPKLDLEVEQKLVAEKLNDLQAQNASEDTITTIMKDFGIKRAKLHGWANTYVFTKAMGEICAKQFRENIPLAIIRPTMVTSTYNEPFPGWIEGLRTIDGVIAAYGKGKVKFFLGGPKSILDLIPGDMVINLIIVAMAAHAKQSCSDIIYHIGSSSRNPICISNIANFLFQYFTQNPLTDKKGKLVKVAKDLFLTENMTTLHLYISIRFMLPLKIAKFGNIASCQYFPDVYTNNNRKLQQMMRLINLFADGNIEKLHTTKSLIAVSGEISCEDLSVKDVQLREKLWKEIDIIVDSAATTSFDARYEFAFGTNTLGALHVLSFAKKCINIKMLVHISTVKAATSKLDFKAEEKTVAEKLNELLAQGASEDEFTLLMKDFGIKRSKLHGWPNTYAFTKAMGEICLRQSKEMLPLIIVRPTMVTGSYKEPSPGWIEGLRTVDAAIASYAKGKIKCFLGNPKLIVDLVS
ncbi:hypothetical protein FEM48_Zijuj12G0128600 [Ziziphus jujuba var. spinosa]|uniref:Fatty acyl-CoA reductase n=1 Tax=Ziziphus jujuba var. spinosa TaxID=714518 RepID=A0A978UDF8_ZIZJJ|nr:hypothetical protein FEM48_Zijuj12G0128600 [Ziziphus jujuba var. spinosa]